MSHIITSVVIRKDREIDFGYKMEVHATFTDGATKKIFTFFDDELSFTEQEFVGLTEEQARNLHTKRDSSYLLGA